MPRRQPAASVKGDGQSKLCLLRLENGSHAIMKNGMYESLHGVKSDLFIILRACASTGWVIMRSSV